MKNVIVLMLLISLFALGCLTAQPPTIRVGLIGLDTSHAPAFTRMLNDSTHDYFFPEARVVGAYPGGSPDVEASYTRVDKFTKQVAGYGVEIVDTIPAMLQNVDAVILTSVDGRVHLEQVKPVIAAGKPVFIDKPMAASLQDVKEIFRLANDSGVPCFSASSLRFVTPLRETLQEISSDAVIGCDVYSPASLEPHHPDLMWYGVHGVEMLFAVMGADNETVRRVHTEGTDVVVGTWSDGRIGTFRGIRHGARGYGAVIYTEEKIHRIEPDMSTLYANLMKEIIAFFRTGKSPIPQEETIAMFRFMQAADESKAQEGDVIRLTE